MSIPFPIERTMSVDLAPLPQPVCAFAAPAASPIDWTVDDLFSAGDVGLIVGDGGSFKSTAAIHLAGAVAGGYKAFDRFPTTFGPVLYVSGEDPGSRIQSTLEAFVRGHQWDRGRVLLHFHYLALAGVSLREGRWKRHLLDVAKDLRPGMVVFDPWVDVAGMEDENSNSEAATVTKFARELARDAQAAVVFVHHANKASDRGNSQARIRGASAIANASRGTLFLDFTQNGVLVEQIKQSYAPKLEPFMLMREITTEPDNRAAWVSARLSTAKPEDVRLNRAQTFVMAQITASPRQLNSTDIKDAAEGSGIWAQHITQAIKDLYALNRIDYEQGPKNARRWFPVVVAVEGRQPAPSVVAVPAVNHPAIRTVGSGVVAAPFRGQPSTTANSLPGGAEV